MRKRTCLLLIFVGAGLLALGHGVRTAARLLAPENVRRMIEDQFETALRGDLVVGRAVLGLDGAVTLSDVSLTAPDGREPLFECDEVRVAFSLAELVRGRAVPRSVSVIRPTIRLRRDPDARTWNFETVLAEPGAPEEVREGELPLSPGLLAGGLALEDATIELAHPRLFTSGEPRSFPGWHLTVARESGIWAIRGTAVAGPIEGTCVNGWVKPGDPVGMSIQFTNGLLMVTDDTWFFIPEGDIVQRDFQPRGRVGAQGEVNLRADGELQYDVRVEVRSMDALLRYYPVPARRVNGSLLINNEGVVVKDLAGVVAAEEFGADQPAGKLVHVRVTGEQRWERERGVFRISAAGVPLSQKAVKAVPVAGPAIWDKLRPAGECDVEVELVPRSGGRDLLYRVVLQLRDGVLRPAQVPVTVRDVAGRAVVEREKVLLENVTGELAPGGDLDVDMPPCRLAASGTWGLDGAETDVLVRLEDLQTSEALLKAIPEHGEAIWENVRPEVTADVEVALAGGPGEQPGVESVELVVHSGSGRVSAWPLPLSGINGQIKVEGHELRIDRLAAVVGFPSTWRTALPTESPLTVTGRIDLAARKADLHVDGRCMVLTEDLVRAIPAVGEGIWQETHPQGVASVNGQVRWDEKAHPPVRCFLDIDLQDVALEPIAVPLPISAATGHLLVMEDHAYANNLVATLAGGRLDVRAVARYGQADQPTYAASMVFRGVQLEQLLQGLGADEANASGRLQGEVEAGGVYGTAASGRQGAFVARGQVQLTDARVTRTPLFSGLFRVTRLRLPQPGGGIQRGRASFTVRGGEVEIESFELTGAGVELSGYGTVGPPPERRLDLMVIAAGARENGGIPVISAVADWLLAGLERQLWRVQVTGTLQQPRYSPQLLTTISAPIRGLQSLLISPFAGGQGETE